MTKAPRKAPKKEQKQVETTGHSWDGIEEYNNPLPRWWLWTFYASIIAFRGDERRNRKETGRDGHHRSGTGSRTEALCNPGRRRRVQDMVHSVPRRGGAGGQGLPLGAPNLTNAIWLYGGSREDIMESVANGRAGVMPNWNVRLSEADIKAVAFYVHGLGGGQ